MNTMLLCYWFLIFNVLKIFVKSVYDTVRYDTLEEFNVDSKAEYSALSSTLSRN